VRNLFFILSTLALFGTASLCPANESMGTPAARVAFEKGEAARWTGNFRAALEAYRRATEIDPDFAKAHENYISMMQLVRPNTQEESAKTESSGNADTEAEREMRADEQVREQLQAEYEELAQQHPDRAVYQWALGYINLERQPRAAEQYFRESLRIDPTFAPAFNSLSVIESARGDSETERNDLRKAVEANPDNPEYLFGYAYELKDVNPQEFLRLSMKLVQKFPDSESACLTLYALADQAVTPEEKIQYLEILKAKFPPSKGYLSEGGIRMLFNVYDRTDPGKGLALAKEMEKARPEEPDWGLYARYEEQMISAERLLAAGNAQDATQLLVRIDLPGYADHARLDLLKARAADASGETERAYQDLLKIFASDPTDELQAAIATYAQKLGKTQNQTDSSVLRMRDANAKPAVPFTLPGYGEQKKVSLSDFRGRVVLLNFWFPECGPCRGEFP
jgi:hypothetical protein